ncbi:very-long-chain 3-oxoacyl-CoA reductase-like isoform X2 [Pseudophryne corroboree]|uniref:very-long-chain 3-oxoacyl-CoA reductase-like isoform X2 n=1 Tax=Pseudophryne corroboree TaxID=495146 RepID=UPI0030819E23
MFAFIQCKVLLCKVSILSNITDGRPLTHTLHFLLDSAETESMWGEELCTWTQGFSLFGILVASYIVIKQTWKVICGLKTHILSRWWKTDLTQYGRWAVVTGATDGIGKGYAQELAKRGLDIVLISRTLEKLQKVAAEIEKEFGCKTRIIQLDFTKGSHIYQTIQAELKGLEIGILVNNVGMKQYDLPAKFLDVPDLDKMTRIILPQMVQRKKGLIINLSSEAGNRPLPKGIIYSATKVFVDFFSRGLHVEYKKAGITVQSVMPLLVSTDMTYNMKPNIFIKTSRAYACEALNVVGYAQRTSGCLSHSLQSYVLSLIPDILLNTISSMNSLENNFKKLQNKHNKSKKKK